MWQTILLSFLAGAMAANAMPHFVKGITREPYPTPGVGLRAPSYKKPTPEGGLIKS
jgi:hypothetical protein